VSAGTSRSTEPRAHLIERASHWIRRVDGHNRGRPPLRGIEGDDLERISCYVVWPNLLVSPGHEVKESRRRGDRDAEGRVNEPLANEAARGHGHGVHRNRCGARARAHVASPD
jgi:hypothetical protein